MIYEYLKMNDVDLFKKDPNQSVLNNKITNEEKTKITWMKKLETIDQYFSDCFECLPDGKVEQNRSNRSLIELYCDEFIFDNQVNAILTLIEEKCNQKVSEFFQYLEYNLENNNFKTPEHFMAYIAQTWDNFITIIVHISDIIKSSNYFGKSSVSHGSAFVIFKKVWQSLLENKRNIKQHIVNTIYNYLRIDRQKAMENIYRYILINFEEDEQRKIIHKQGQHILSYTKNLNYKEPYSLDESKGILVNQTRQTVHSDEVIARCIHILDISDMYDEIEKFYIKETYTQCEEITQQIREFVGLEQIEKREEQDNSETNKENGHVSENIKHNENIKKKLLNELVDLPAQIENFLCQEQIRCRKFFKSSTESTIIEKLMEILLYNQRDILYSEHTITTCIIKENLQSLRVLYWFAFRTNWLFQFKDMFFLCVKKLGINLVEGLIKHKNNPSVLNQCFTDLINFKLNIDRIMIIPFGYSKRFLKKWKEMFECFLNTGSDMQGSIPVVFALYLNILMIMHMICLMKMEKVHLLFEKLKTYLAVWKHYKLEDFIGKDEKKKSDEENISVEEDVFSQISIDSQKLEEIKNNIEEVKEGSKRQNVNQFTKQEEFNLKKEQITQCITKTKKWYKQYYDIGKNIFNKIKIVLSMFRFINDKEKFEEFYRDFMLQRIVNYPQVNICLDIKIFKSLRKECGSLFCKDIEGILKDSKNSENCVRKFYKLEPLKKYKLLVKESKTEMIERNENKSGRRSKHAKEKEENQEEKKQLNVTSADEYIIRQLIEKKRYFVNVISKDSWKFEPWNKEVEYPSFIKACNTIFRYYYKEFCNDKQDLMFVPCCGTCTLELNLVQLKKKYQETIMIKTERSYNPNGTINYDSKKTKPNIENLNKESKDWNSTMSLTITILQGIVLLLFNEKQEYTKKEIYEATKIPEDKIMNIVKPLCGMDDLQILLYDERKESFKLNTAFEPKKKFYVVNFVNLMYTFQKEESKIKQSKFYDGDRINFIRAHVVRCTKINKEVKAEEIIEYVKEKISNLYEFDESIVRREIGEMARMEHIYLHNDKYTYDKYKEA